MNRIIPVSDFIRNFGDYADMLPALDKIVLTREGRPFATVKATPEEKNRELLNYFGLWRGTKLDSDKIWAKVLKRKNRRRQIKL